MYLTDKENPRQAGAPAEGDVSASTPAHCTPHPRSYEAWAAKQRPPFSDDWRRRLPNPAAYYAERLDKLTKPNGNGWAMALCPFHKDSAPSLAVNLEHGGFKCHACGASGDLVGFHCRIAGLSFKAALRDMGVSHG